MKVSPKCRVCDKENEMVGHVLSTERSSESM